MKRILFTTIVFVMGFVASCGTKTSQLTPLVDLPSNYNEENVKADGGIVIGQESIMLEECRPAWEAFLENVEKGKDSTIRIIKSYYLEDESQSDKAICDLSYKDGKYLYSYIDNNELVCEEYTHFKGLYGDYAVLWMLSDCELKWDNLNEQSYRYVFMTKKTENDIIEEEKTKEIYSSKEEAMADGCVIYENVYQDGQYVGSYVIENSLPLWEQFLKDIEEKQKALVRIVRFDPENEYDDEGIPVDISYKDEVYTYSCWQSGEIQTYTYTYMITWETQTALGKEIEYILTDYEDITPERYFQVLIGVILPEEEAKKYKRVESIVTILKTDEENNSSTESTEETTTIAETTVNPFEGIEENIEVSDVAGKVYTYQNGGFGLPNDEFSISVHKDGTFSYYEGSFSSHIGVGNWEIEGSVIVFREPVQKIELINYFYLKDGNLVFKEDGSTRYIHMNDIKNGELFYGSKDKYVELYGD